MNEQIKSLNELAVGDVIDYIYEVISVTATSTYRGTLKVRNLNTDKIIVHRSVRIDTPYSVTNHK